MQLKLSRRFYRLFYLPCLISVGLFYYKSSISKDIQSIFHHHVKENAYVPQKTKCPSLGAILIPAHNIEFFTEDGKLRARITDYSKQSYELKVSCKYLRDIFEKDKDVKNLNNAIAASQYAHCRIGLARKFLMQENHCYLMLNGLFLYWYDKDFYNWF